MHWPAPMTKDGKADKERDWLDTWKDMERVYKAHPDKVKAIGVSNFPKELIEGLIKATGVTPTANQIEAHPLLLQDELVQFCKEHNIHLTAYSPLGNNSTPFSTFGVQQRKRVDIWDLDYSGRAQKAHGLP